MTLTLLCLALLLLPLWKSPAPLLQEVRIRRSSNGSRSFR